MYYYRKTREEKNSFQVISSVKHTKNLSLDMIRLLLRATNSILEAKPTHILKVVYAPAVYVMMMRLTDSGWNLGECAISLCLD